MLMVPMFNFAAEHYLAKNDPVFSWWNETSTDQQLDLQETIYDIARHTEIPDEHVINAWKLLRQDRTEDPNKVLDSDHLHPNQRGHGKIAQEFFMKMSLSPSFLQKQQLVTQGKEKNFNQAVLQKLS